MKKKQTLTEMEKQLKKTTSKGAGAKCSKANATVKITNRHKKNKSDLKAMLSSSEKIFKQKKASPKTTKKDKTTDKKIEQPGTSNLTKKASRPYEKSL